MPPWYPGLTDDSLEIQQYTIALAVTIKYYSGHCCIIFDREPE